MGLAAASPIQPYQQMLFVLWIDERFELISDFEEPLTGFAGDRFFLSNCCNQPLASGKCGARFLRYAHRRPDARPSWKMPVRRREQTNERKGLTLTGLLMEGTRLGVLP